MEKPPQQHTHLNTPQMNLKDKKKRAISRKACENCRKAHSCCSENRPCKRCTSLQMPCFDIPSKKRGRKRKFNSSDSNSEEQNEGEIISSNETIHTTNPTPNTPIPPFVPPTLKVVLPKTNGRRNLILNYQNP
jgi:hypothetical protein